MGNLSVNRCLVIWSHNRYHRADMSGGRLQTILDSASWLKTLLRYGYVIAVADVRGSGASFGSRAGPYSIQDAQDAYDVTEWLAAQPWCDGKVACSARRSWEARSSWRPALRRLTSRPSSPRSRRLTDTRNTIRAACSWSRLPPSGAVSCKRWTRFSRQPRLTRIATARCWRKR